MRQSDSLLFVPPSQADLTYSGQPWSPCLTTGRSYSLTVLGTLSDSVPRPLRLIRGISTDSRATCALLRIMVGSSYTSSTKEHTYCGRQTRYTIQGRGFRHRCSVEFDILRSAHVSIVQDFRRVHFESPHSIGSPVLDSVNHHGNYETAAASGCSLGNQGYKDLLDAFLRNRKPRIRRTLRELSAL